MRTLLVALAVIAVAAAVPKGRRLRPEEHWRPAGPRDLSKYKPKHPTVDAKAEYNWEKEMEKITRVAKQMRTQNLKTEQPDTRATCGMEGPAKDKIVGGHEAQEHQWPWIVALFIDDAWFCGGALISENFVLTAAHCADGASYFDIMAGAHNVRASSEPHRVEITSYNGWTHPQWNEQNLANDLALIELPSNIDFNDYIKPSCLPEANDEAMPGDLVTCIGWGKPSDSAGGISPVLRMVEDRPVISNQECNNIYGIVGDGIVCIDTTGGKGTCNGDSGGPLNMKVSSDKAPGQQWKQVGIVSFGSSAGCEVGLPAGFTRTEYYLDWIKSQTGIP